MKQLKLPILLSFISLLLSALIANASPHVENFSHMQQDILRYINEYRTAHHLSTLTLIPAISQEATQHSLEMAHHTTAFGHAKFNERINRLYKKLKGATGGAENVAYNYKSAKEVVKQWLLSPGHRRNIQGHYHLTGIGIARDNQGRLYYTQLFIRTHLS